MNFSGDRLRTMRRFYNLTQRELGDRIGSPASTITNYELGRTAPKGLALDALCVELAVQPDFFDVIKKDDEFTEPETNFRSLTSTPERARKKVLAHATLFGVMLDYMGSVIARRPLALPSVPVMTLSEIERAAERCRIDLGVGIDAPIESVTHMVELAGVVVTNLDAHITRQVDAFSRYGQLNLIVLNPAKNSAARKRFDLSHEIGHGVLHRDGVRTELGVREEQANYFASALLMPERAFAREFFALGRDRSWDKLLHLKQRWGASVAAIVVRAYHLGLIDAAEYRRRYKYMAKQGWLKGGEPQDIDGERPQLFELMLSRFQQQTGKSTLDIANDLRWKPDLFRQVAGVDAVAGEPPKLSTFEEFRQRKMAAG